jgi:serine/threonine-protein kinase
MPNIKGMTTREARLNLMRLGLALGDIAKERNDSIAEDRVIAQSVQAGKTVKTGTAISVLISEGPESVKLPDLFGVSLEAARSLLNDYGLTVGAITPIPTGAFEPNTVIGSVPPADSMVALGDPVSLQVSTNP